MDRNQRDELRRWAGRLGELGSSPDAKAAGRAIALLVDEVDRLEGEVGRLRDELDAHADAEREREREETLRAERRKERERRRRETGRRVVAIPAGRRAATAAPPSSAPAGEEAAASLPDGERPVGRASRPGEPKRLPSVPGEVLRPAKPRGRRPGPRRPLLPRVRVRRPSVAAPSLPRPGRKTLAAVVLMVFAASAVGVGARVAGPELAEAGPRVDSLIGAAAAADLVFAVTGSAEVLAKVRWTVNGEDVTEHAAVANGRAFLRGSDLPDGEYEIAASLAGRFPGLVASHRWTVSIDRTPPAIEVDPATTRGSPLEPVTIRGTTEEGATLTANGQEVEVNGGSFAVTLPEPPAQPVKLHAADRHGNTAAAEVTIDLVPREPPFPIRSVHVTFHAWADDKLRGEILRLVDEGRINSVELDLKDESGIVGWDADLPFGKQIGAVQKIFELDEAIDLLHSKGIYVIGRIVAFRDPIHAQEAWKRGWRNQVVQAPDGGLYGGYGGFTNFANPVVRKYNIDVAVLAVEAGVDDILYDYIRRPDGPTASMRFPQLQGTPEASIVSFIAEARQALKPYGVFLGASVFGVAATRPHEVAQDIPGMARHADYIAPMLYPSHWGPGEYDVANPNAQPYDIIFRSLKDFQEQTEGTGARVVPWLQDFSLGVSYGAAEVRAQIKAAKDAGVDEWILWDPLVTYTRDALDPMPKNPPIETRRGKPEPVQAAAPAQPKQQAQQGKQQAQGQPARQAAAADAAGAAKVKANELGVVPVLMYHQIREDGGGDYDLTPAEFRAELARLHREGYVPVRAVDLANGRLNVPAGKTPAVLTFDDSTKEQLMWDERKRPLPNTAIGIMLDFAAKNPGFEPAGTFYVNRDPFAGDPRGAEMLRWLHENGFELGNHTYDHTPFHQLSGPQEVQKQLALGAKLITDTVPDAKVRTMALPLGVMPEPPQLARKGTWNGLSYEHAGVMLVGAEPAPSPFSSAFKPGAIPRIRTSPPGARDGHMGSTYWLDHLKENPGRRYVSDGNPNTISFPKERAGDLAPRFRERANPY